MMSNKRILTFCLMGIALTSRSFAEERQRKPDIVVYLADDLSAADLPLYGGTNIETPSINQLAADGLTFHRAFVASPSCAPSRAALLTGLMPARNGAGFLDENSHSHVGVTSSTAELHTSMMNYGLPPDIWNPELGEASIGRLVFDPTTKPF